MPTYLSPGIYIEEVSSGSRPIEGVGTAVAAFVGIAEKGPVNTPTLVSNWSQFTATFGEFIKGGYLAHAVYAYFTNQGGNCYVVRIGHDDSNGASNGSTRKPAAATADAQAVLGSYRISMRDPALAGAEIAVEVEEAGGEAPTDEMFKIVVKQNGQQVEEWDRAQVQRGRHNIATLVNANSKIIRIEEISSPTERPAIGASAVLVETAPATARELALSADDYVGDVAERTGFGGLEAIDEVTMVAVPDLMGAYRDSLIDLETVQAVQVEMIAHCERMGDRVAILDAPPGMNAQQVKEWRVDRAGYDSSYATLYWPWVRAFDPASKKSVLLPPSGHIAGIWSRNDDTRGVHKAPANEVVLGAIGLETQITKNEHDLLNPHGINCLRVFPGRGIRVWGARTLSSDPGWRYLNIRRMFNYLEESILNSTSWVVFEPNDPALWARVRRNISAFLVNEWRRGALFGLTPDEAFYVKCDDETNTTESIEAGQVICEIGVAPVRPAEFVVFRLSQFSGGTSMVTE